MSGIIFLKTRELEKISQFYLDIVGCTHWLTQDNIEILKHGNFIFGFHQSDTIDKECLLTFFYNSRADVDKMYAKLERIAVDSPKNNEKYDIYHFFASDPEGRKLEFQSFNNFVDNYLSGDELLLTRRSIRKYRSAEVSEETLRAVVDLSRYAPTARNTQPYYFIPVRDKEILRKLSELRGSSTKPINNAPMAVAIVSDPIISTRHIQDGCIAAYHFILAAWCYGLGTCWIAALDREDVKTMLDIPQKHYVVTVTPLGYPDGDIPTAPIRKEIDYFLK